MLDFLSGKKTYIMAILMIVVAGASLIGVYIPGFETVNAGQLLTEAFALIFLRQGIAKSGPSA